MIHAAEHPLRTWRAVVETDDDAEYFAAWLARLAQGVPGAREAVLVLGDEPNTGPFFPVSHWPDGNGCSPELAAACERALDLRLPTTSRSDGKIYYAQPVVLEGNVHGIVGMCCTAGGTASNVHEDITWACGWLLLRLGRNEDNGAELRERLLLTLDLVMGAIEEPRGLAACQAVVTEAAVRLGCDRVSVGFGKGEDVRLAALSHSADIGRRVDLTHAIEAAMNEAAEQGAAIVLEDGRQPEDDRRLISVREHQRLARDFGSGGLVSVPFAAGENRNGVFLFEWGSDKAPTIARAQAEALAIVLGRVLLDKRHADRGLLRRTVDASGDLLGRLFGPRYLGTKLLVLVVLALGVFLSVARGEFRISADASLEGGIRRMIVAPYDGFIIRAEARAGQEVRAGDLLAALDDRELHLEAQRWASQEEQFTRQAHLAEAQADLAQIQIALAQVRQAQAQRALAEFQMERARLRAPFDGLVVAGDLSQHLGGAVRKGQTLFEVTPLGSYRIVLEVDEADIAHVKAGQKGVLVATALTGEQFPFTVALVSPVATARDGKNYFRVEAVLDENSARLRPGMEGVGKIGVDEQRLAWIWTRGLVEWLRLRLWTWFGV